MKKTYFITFLLLICINLIFAQRKDFQFGSIQKNYNDKITNPLDFRSLIKKYIAISVETEQGRFAFTTKDNRDLLYIRDFGPADEYQRFSYYTSHVNLVVDNKVYSQNKHLPKNNPSASVLPTPNITIESDLSKITCDYGYVNGITVKQELIPKENERKRAGAVLIKYIFYNPNSYVVKVGAALKLDTKIGGTGYQGGSDSARIATQTKGFIRNAQYVGTKKDQMPDFWLAFENPLDSSALVARGTLRGKDLVVPDIFYIGNYPDIQNYGYKDPVPLREGIPYDDSAVLLEWNEIDVPPGGTVYFSTLYGMAEIDYVPGKLNLTCSVSSDTLAPNSQNEYDPFDYLVTVLNPVGIEKNLKIKIKFDNNIFYLNNPGDTVRTDIIGGGEQKLYSWKIYPRKDIFLSGDYSIRVDAYSESVDTADGYCVTKIYVPANKAKLTTSVNPANKGTVTPSGETIYNINENISVRATSSDPCWEFEKWSGDYTGLDNPTTIIMDRSKSIIANFKKKEFTLNITYVPQNAGTVTKYPDKPNSIYQCSENVILTAVPITGYRFIGWDGDLKSTANPSTITMDANKSVIARFEYDSFNVVINVNPANMGKVTVGSPINKVVTSSSSFKVKNGDEITLTQTPTDCYKFINWSGDTTTTNSEIKLRVWKDKTFTANFEKKKFKLTISTDNNGSITPANASREYDCGEVVTITANPNKCYSFDRWHYQIEGFPTPSDTSLNPITIPVLANITATAYFKIIDYKLVTSISPVGAGRVNGKISDTAWYNCNSTVTLTANPEPCYNFLYWSDDTTNKSISRSVIMATNKNIQAVFKIKKFSVTGTTDYPNGGTISKSPDSISYDCGRTVNLTINPSKCFSFINWGGNAEGTQTTIPITLDTNKYVVARTAQIIFSFNKVEQTFPNVTLDFKVDSIPLNSQGFLVSQITKSMLIVKDSSKKDGARIISNYALRTNTNPFKIIYTLPNRCYDSPEDTARYATVALNRGNCYQSQIVKYSIPLYAGCDSCSRILRRKDTSKTYLSKLYVNHPNPFNPETRIRYSISTPDHVSLIVYDMLGREVASLVNEYMEPGEYEVRFTPNGLPSGVYFYRIKAGNFNDIKKMMFVK